MASIHPKTPKLIVHRVLKEEGGFYSIKGDNTKTVDIRIPRDNIVAHVTRVERGGRRVSLGLGAARRLIVFFQRRAYFIRFCNCSGELVARLN